MSYRQVAVVFPPLLLWWEYDDDDDNDDDDDDDDGRERGMTDYGKDDGRESECGL
jgi:hypothetical protein